MRNRYVLVLAATLFILLMSSVKTAAQDLRLGIITDFEDIADSSNHVNNLIEEIQRTIGNTRNVVVPQGNVVFAKGSYTNTVTAYNQLVNSSDVILAFGPVCIRAIIDGGVPPVPTIGLGIIDPELLNIPLTDNGNSALKNFTFISIAKDFYSEILHFYDIYNFKSLTVLTNEIEDGIFNEELVAKKVKALQDSLNTVINFLEVEKGTEVLLSGMCKDCDAVYIAMPLETSENFIKNLSDQLIEKKLPSFSSNKWHVDNGIMASLTVDNAHTQIYRRISIMIDDALSGIPIEEQSVDLNTKEELYINMSTARKIHFFPKFKHLFVANFVKDEADVTNTYSLSEIMSMAIDNNVSIKVSNKELELTMQDIAEAKTRLMPTVELSATGTQINDERASTFSGQAETTLSGAATLQQLLYSEEAIAAIKINRHLSAAKKYSREQEVLKVMLDVYTAYFNMLSAKSYLSIQDENLSVSKKNLDLAKIRVSLGSSNKADVYRWESEVANAMQSVVEANIAVFTRKLQLNSMLDNKLDEDFEVEDVDIDDKMFNELKRTELYELISDPVNTEILIGFLITEAKKTHPAKRELLENIKAVDRQHKMNRRMFYTPTLALQGQYSSIFHRAGKGSEDPDPSSGFAIERSDNNWNVGVSVTYPLFAGKLRKVKYNKTKIQTEQLEYSRRNLDNNLELSITTNIMQLISALTNTDFSYTSADNAKKNFELVQDSYKQGVVSIVDLIDAQKASLQAKLSYSISIYDLIIAYYKLEYSIGSFSSYLLPEDRRAMDKRFMDFRRSIEEAEKLF
jgi:outer membrane protein TolC